MEQRGIPSHPHFMSFSYCRTSSVLVFGETKQCYCITHQLSTTCPYSPIHCTAPSKTKQRVFVFFLFFFFLLIFPSSFLDFILSILKLAVYGETWEDDSCESPVVAKTRPTFSPEVPAGDEKRQHRKFTNKKQKDVFNLNLISFSSKKKKKNSISTN